MVDPSSQAVWRPPGVHLTRIDADLVVLDVGRDRYHCLPGLADQLVIAPDGRLDSPDPGLLAELIAAGLAVAVRPEPLPAAAVELGPLALRETPPAPAPPRADILRAGLALAAATAAFRRRSLAQLIVHGASARPVRPVDEALVARLVGAARIARPWIPFEGECLQRAFQLRWLLARWDVTVDWVFGVRTWPFGAHCWLQSGDLVIGDRLDRVRRYTPILRA